MTLAVMCWAELHLTCGRMGVWTDSESRLKIGREKFAALAVPRSFLVGSDFCVDN